MCLLFESIKVKNGKIYNLEYHQQRVDKHSTINLFAYINKDVVIPVVGEYKLRILYTRNHVQSHSIELYSPKKLESLRIVIDNSIDYHKKYENRTDLDNLMAVKGECDDILIIKNNLVCDTSFSNIIFFDGEKWITPEKPLLEGTCRARLMAQKIISPQLITFNDLKLFSKFLLINAMLDFDIKRSAEYYLNGDIIYLKTKTLFKKPKLS